MGQSAAPRTPAATALGGPPMFGAAEHGSGAPVLVAARPPGGPEEREDARADAPGLSGSPSTLRFVKLAPFLFKKRKKKKKEEKQSNKTKQIKNKLCICLKKNVLVVFGTFLDPPGAGNGPKMWPRGSALERRSIVQIRPMAEPCIQTRGPCIQTRG